ncbi:MAG: VOC family protein [Steroidobacteraceae bacterium]|jgi:hypothetical protein|nr:VOC family protein [Steroidobacteraceae bacterium]
MFTTRSLDHFVVYAQDLGLAAAAWRRLGFTVMPIMEHATIGTSNAVVQFARTYLELLGDLDHCRNERLQRNLRGCFPSFDGYYMTSFTSTHLEPDHAALKAAGIDIELPNGASRRVRLPAGGWIDTASRSMYAFNAERPRMSLFRSDHPRPEAIWIPDYQAHANSAIDVATVHYAARDVGQDVEFFAKMMDGAPAERGRDRVMFRTANGQSVEIHAVDAAGRRWPEFTGLQGDAPAHGIGLSIRVGSLAQARRVLGDGGVSHRAADRRIVVHPSHANGVFVEFVEENYQP